MDQKLSELAKAKDEQAKEYFQFIKSSTRDGSFFKDALDWYFFRYLTPICDRTLLIFGAIIAVVVLYCLIQMIKSAFPLEIREPVIIRSLDQTQYFPHIIPLRPRKGQDGFDPDIRTVDEAVAKYLLSFYVKDREGYDFSKGDVEEVNKKFNHMRNLSSASEYKTFQLIMSKDNPTSPINDFDRDVVKTIEIDSVKFIRKDAKGFKEQALEFLSNNIPTQTDIRFTATTKTTDDNEETKSDKQRYLAKINFTFDGVNKDDKGGVVKFAVNSYTLYKVK
ncbi:MAG: hypothetical protein FJX34_03265 [Alphaproteobacteria bacterium]|nr:hypothetical protein [Alphaproteobacteria bacterium]